jgi:hypothetical protein
VDIKGQQPSILVNPLRHKAIIGHRLANMKRSPYLATDLGGRRWSVSPECLAFVPILRWSLVTRRAIWNPGPNVEGLKYSDGVAGSWR